MKTTPDQPGFCNHGLIYACALVCLGVNATLPFLQPGSGEAVPTLALFVGRFHPMVLHMPIGFVALAALVEIGRLPWLRGLAGEIPARLTTFLLLCSTLAATIATVCGWLLSFSGGYDEKLLDAHFNSGIATAIALAVALALQTAAPVGKLSAAYRVVFFAVCIFITVAGHKGSELTHGETYLTEYAPNFIRKMLGLPIKDSSNSPATAERDVYTGVIQPIFDQKCTSCHGPSKSKGGLRLDSYEHAMKGGDEGPGFVAGKPDQSPILQRIHLPEDDDDHMPPSGKPQLTPNETALVEWWITVGAPQKGPLSSFSPPSDLVSALEKETGTSKPPADQKQAAAEIDKSLASVRENLKGTLKPIVPGEPSLEYVAGGDYAVVDDSQIAKLSPVAAQIRRLDLNRAAVTDASAAAIAAMTNLESLSLQGTKVGDATIEALATLPNLTVINIYGTKVTDTGLLALSKLPKLRALYLWQTPTTPDGEKKLLEAKPGLRIFGENPPKT